MRGTIFPGSWSTWDGEGRGKRRSKTLKVASKCMRGESRRLRKNRRGRLEVEDPMVPGEPKDERGGSKPYVSYSLQTTRL
jgi:hypothetical protein